MTAERLPRSDEYTIACLCVGLCGKLDTTRPPRVEALNPAGQSGYWVGRSVGRFAGELLSDRGPGLRARPPAIYRRVKSERQQTTSLLVAFHSSLDFTG